jgi:hypothetical protein
MNVRSSFIVLLSTVALLAGCSMVPNMDAGSAGCQNAKGIGVGSDDAPEVMAEMTAEKLGDV